MPVVSNEFMSYDILNMIFFRFEKRMSDLNRECVDEICDAGSISDDSDLVSR